MGGIRERKMLLLWNVSVDLLPHSERLDITLRLASFTTGGSLEEAIVEDIGR